LHRYRQRFTENLPGNEHLYILKHQIKIGDRLVDDSTNITLLEELKEKNIYPQVCSPSVEILREKFLQLAEQYQEVVVILLSSLLNPSSQNAREAIMKLRSPAPIHIIDSQTTATGLGILVQAALNASTSGRTGVEIHRIVRGLIKHIYAIFCLPDLKYLHHSGVLDPAQAIVGEMLKITPFFIPNRANFQFKSPKVQTHNADILQFTLNLYQSH
jgi:DegV family protein with EDD domain